MFREIVTSSITLANSGIVIGGNIAPAVSGLTVKGDVSATGTIYSKLLIIGGVSATGSTLSSALVTFPTPETVPGMALGDVFKYQETTPGVSGWSSGRVSVEELLAEEGLKDGAIVTYSEDEGNFVAKDPEKQVTQETSYIKQMGKCSQCRGKNLKIPGYAAITNDSRVVAWGYLPEDIIGKVGPAINPSNNVRIPFWAKYDGYQPAQDNTVEYRPYGGDFLDEQSTLGNRYIISDLYWSRHAAMALVSSANEYGGDVWVAGKNAPGLAFTVSSNPNGIVKTKYNNFIISNGLAAAAGVGNAGGIYLFNPEKDISAIQKYNAGISQDIIADMNNLSALSATDYYFVSDANTVKMINNFGEALSSYTGAPSAFGTARGLTMVQSTTGLNDQLNRDLLYVCDSIANNRIKVYDITNIRTDTTSFKLLSVIGGAVATMTDGETDSPTSKPGFKSIKKIASDPNDKNTLYVTDSHTIRRVYRKPNGHWKVTVLSKTGDVSGTDLGSLRSDGNGIAQFSDPQGIKVDNDGSIYVADTGNKRIVKITKTENTESSFVGTSTKFIDGTYQTKAKFNEPHGIVKDKNNNIYIADRLTHTIRKLTFTPGTSTYSGVSTFAGDGTAGLKGGILSAARFNEPTGITYREDNDRLYVTNLKGNAISEINLTTSNVTLIAGSSAGTPGFKNGLGNNAQFKSPGGITYANNALYVSDRDNHALRRIDLAGGGYNVTTIAGVSALDRNKVTYGVAATVLSGGDALKVKLNQPRAIFYHTETNSLYFSHLFSIQKMDLSDNKISTVAGTGLNGNVDGLIANSAKFGKIRAMAVSGADVYVTDVDNFCVRKISNFTSNVNNQRKVSRYAGTGIKGYKDGAALTVAKFGDNLRSIYLNENEFLVTENHSLRAIYSSGGNNYVKTINGGTTASTANKKGEDTLTLTKNIQFAGLDIDENNVVYFTDLSADSIGSSDGSSLLEYKKINTGYLGIGPGSNKSTAGFIKVIPVDRANADATPKFTRIQFVGDTVKSLLFAALDTGSSLWVWGNSLDGAFGTGQLSAIGPTKVYQFENNIKDFQITCSTDNVSLISIITKDNKLFSAGDNTKGQLGRNTFTETSAASFKTFKQCMYIDGSGNTIPVDNAEKIIVSNETGYKNNLYISTTKEVYACGDNTTGVLGRGAVASPSAVYVKVDNLTDVAYLLGAANGATSNYANHTIFALKENGELWSWGYNGGAIGQTITNNTDVVILSSPGPCYNYETRDNVINAKNIFCNDNPPLNESTIAYIDNANYLYVGGFSTEAHQPDNPASISFFRKFNMKNVAPDVNLVADKAIIHRTNGTVYEITSAGASKVF